MNIETTSMAHPSLTQEADAALRAITDQAKASKLATVIELAETVNEAHVAEPIHQDRVWSDERWTARVIKKDDDDGWAVAMMLHGESEPALVGPWTMGRDKKNPKPLDVSAFNTLVKTATEVLRRHEQQLYARLNRSVTVTADGRRIRVALTIVPNEDGATASLVAADDFGEELGRVPVSPAFQLTVNSALAWAESGFVRPA